VPITVFVTCLADTFYPHAAGALTRIFDHLGLGWTCPTDQTCCGQPMFNAGHFDQARIAAEHFLDVFEPAPGDIVCPSGSCAAMVRHQYLRLFEDDPARLERARKIAART